MPKLGQAEPAFRTPAGRCEDCGRSSVDVVPIDTIRTAEWPPPHVLDGVDEGSAWQCVECGAVGIEVRSIGDNDAW